MTSTTEKFFRQRARRVAVFAVVLALVGLVHLHEPQASITSRGRPPEISDSLLAVHRTMPRWRSSRYLRKYQSPAHATAGQRGNTSLVNTAPRPAATVPTWFELEMRAVSQPAAPADAAIPPPR